MTATAANADLRLPDIHLRAEDFERLSTLVTDQDGEGVVALLQQELGRVVVVTDVRNDDVVGLDRWVYYTDGRSDRTRRVKIVMPVDADIDAGLISPLSYVGAGLLGLAQGESILWPDPSGAERRLTIILIEDREELV
ncbi:GreA/GreB family elongation factor [Brevundimonas sp.]